MPRHTFHSNGKAAFIRANLMQKLKNNLKNENDPNWRLGIGLLVAVKGQRVRIIFDRILSYAQWELVDWMHETYWETTALLGRFQFMQSSLCSKTTIVSENTEMVIAAIRESKSLQQLW